MGKKEDLTLLRDFKKKIEMEFPVEKVILFGSRVKGKAKDESDFDLVIISDAFEDMRQLEREQRMHLLWEYAYPLDVVCYTGEEFKRKSALATIAREAKREGVEI